jgi:hypothetical protein
VECVHVGLVFFIQIPESFQQDAVNPAGQVMGVGLTDFQVGFISLAGQYANFCTDKYFWS